MYLRSCVLSLLSDLVGSRMMNFLQPPPMYSSLNTENQDSHKVPTQVWKRSWKHWLLEFLLPMHFFKFNCLIFRSWINMHVWQSRMATFQLYILVFRMMYLVQKTGKMDFGHYYQILISALVLHLQTQQPNLITSLRKVSPVCTTTAIVLVGCV